MTAAETSKIEGQGPDATQASAIQNDQPANNNAERGRSRGRSFHRKRSYEVHVAVIGLVGIVASNLITNWDKLFPSTRLVTAEMSRDYHPTSRYETELRYYFDVSGTRDAIRNMQKELANGLKMTCVAQPESAKECISVIDASISEGISVDDAINALLPVYKEHFSVDDLQQLNRFYSTPPMQNLVQKLPLLARDAAPVQIKVMQEYQARLMARLDRLRSEKTSSQ